jgi:hypothetical protein
LASSLAGRAGGRRNSASSPEGGLTTEEGVDLEQEATPDKSSTDIVVTAGMSKTPVSVVKYNHWTLVDAKRELGVQVRAEEAALQRRLENTRAAYHEARSKKTAVGRGQLDATQTSVKEYRSMLDHKGQQGREELSNLRSIAHRQKKDWAAHGARNAAVHGVEQKKRVLEAKAERLQARRNAALQTRQEAAARKDAARVAEMHAKMDRQSRLDRVRQNIPSAASLAEAREFFLKQKRDAAADVRSSSRGWESERKRESSQLLAKANANKAVVLATRQQAANNRATVVQSRQQMAQKIRTALEDMEKGRRDHLEAIRQDTSEDHRRVYERKFVSPVAGTRVETSEYGTLVASFRYAGEFSTASSSAPPSRPKSALPDGGGEPEPVTIE